MLMFPSLVFALSCSLPALQGTPKPLPPQEAMDYGPCLSGTIGGAWDSRNFAVKGLVLRMEGGNLCFDTALLRSAFGWTGGFLKLRGTQYDGSHGTHPMVKGRQVYATPRVAGWSLDGIFADPRPLGYGPLPPKLGRFKGFYLHGRQVVVSYEFGGRGILESGRMHGTYGEILGRPIEVGPGGRDLYLLAFERKGARLIVDGETLQLVETKEHPGLVSKRALDGDWSALFGGPSQTDAGQAAKGVRFSWVSGKGLSAPHGRAGATKDGGLPRLNDGERAQNSDDTSRCVWFDGPRARVLADLGKHLALRRVQTFSWHRGDRARQNFDLYGSNAERCPDPKAEVPGEKGWTFIARVSTEDLPFGKAQASSVGNYRAGLGTFRWLLFDIRKPRGGSGTFFHEIDLYQEGQKCSLDEEVYPQTTITAAAFVGGKGLSWDLNPQGRAVLRVPASTEKQVFEILVGRGDGEFPTKLRKVLNETKAPASLEALTKGGPPRWKEVLETRFVRGKTKGAYAVDSLEIPFDNPWHSRLRFGAFDFFPDGKRAALSTWNGDVWIVDGLDREDGKLFWKRFGTGLYDALGLKIVDGKILVNGRDRITRLHDLNGDGEADYYESFNDEVIATEAFHEFSFDLQEGPDGSLYFSKAGPVRAGGRGFEKILPHHGAILRIPPNGKGIQVVATGLRAPNGISISPDGKVLTSGDNEGSWMPQCRLNWIPVGEPYFAGVVPAAHRRETPKIYDDPLCWIPWDVDNSSGGQCWVTSKSWGPFEGDLLHLSYGTCSLFKVLVDRGEGPDAGRVQGGVVRFPLRFASSAMRARFHPKTGQLYLVGFKGWQTSAARLSAFHRIRYTGKPVHLPGGIKIHQDGIRLSFTEPLDRETAEDPESWSVQRWNYKWSPDYGSREYSLKDPKKVGSTKSRGNKYAARDEMKILSARLSKDGRSVFLRLSDLKRVMQMRIAYNLDAADGSLMKNVVYLTVNFLHPPQAGK